MRNYFDEQLALLNTELIEMGALCEDIIAITPRALEADSASTVKKPLLLTRKSAARNGILKGFV